MVPVVRVVPGAGAWRLRVVGVHASSLVNNILWRGMGIPLTWERGGKYYIFATLPVGRFVICKDFVRGVPHYMLSKGRAQLAHSLDVEELKAKAEALR